MGARESFHKYWTKSTEHKEITYHEIKNFGSSNIIEIIQRYMKNRYKYFHKNKLRVKQFNRKIVNGRHFTEWETQMVHIHANRHASLWEISQIQVTVTVLFHFASSRGTNCQCLQYQALVNVWKSDTVYKHFKKQFAIPGKAEDLNTLWPINLYMFKKCYKDHEFHIFFIYKLVVICTKWYMWEYSYLRAFITKLKKEQEQSKYPLAGKL